VIIYEFSRLNFVNTVLSKRKLQWFVTNKFVQGWDDPRFPTVRGILRRGLTVEALLEFILDQGPSKNVNLMEWDKLWTINKKVIDPLVPRFMAVARDAVVFELVDGPKIPDCKMRDLHPKDPSIGQSVLMYYKEILLEAEDAASAFAGEEITLMRWGNAIVESVETEKDSNGNNKVTKIKGRLNLAGDFKLTKRKLHWVPNLPDQVCKCILREFDNLIKKKKPEEEDRIEDIAEANSVHDSPALVDPAVRTLQKGDVIQLKRRGYFRIDSVHWPGRQELVMIKIPDGKTKAVSTITTKVDASKLSRGTA